jgi:hypothetical protein
MVDVIERDAVISPCGKYRYTLKRAWKEGGGVCVFLMLNPSIADALRDDATIRRCIGFAHRWGYQILHVVNIFALRSTDPKLLYRMPDPVGPDNDKWIMELTRAANCVVAAWGTHGSHMGRATEVLKMLKGATINVWALGLTKDLHPRHPLYAPNDAQLVPVGKHKECCHFGHGDELPGLGN